MDFEDDEYTRNIVHNTTIRFAPHALRWMFFVDGENFTIRAEEHARAHGLRITAPDCSHLPGVYLWSLLFTATAWPATVFPNLQELGRRAHYYTSVKADHVEIDRIRAALHRMDFKPTVIKRASGTRKAKAVDISLATDMLSNAFHDNYDAAVLLSGDGDFCPVVEEIQRLGKVVYVMTMGIAGVSNELLLASDAYRDISKEFFRLWDEEQKPGPSAE